MTCSGASAMTVPMVSNPARPARPPIWWNSRADRRRVEVPSYFDSAVNTTVRIGTLMPTPSVSVPQITFSRPACARRSTRRRYLGSMPAWCTPMPWRTNRDSVLPKPAANRKPPMASAMASFSARVQTLMLISAWARSTAAACVKWTTYTGVWWVASSSSSVSVSETMRKSCTSGTGRVAERTTATGRDVRRVRSSTKRDTSPRVADSRMCCASVSSSSGTCQAQPRSGSAKKWNSSITTWSTGAARPWRSARLARISAVQQMMGAEAFTEASPVSMPTRSGPNVADSSKNFSDTSALMGAV